MVKYSLNNQLQKQQMDQTKHVDINLELEFQQKRMEKESKKRMND